MLHTHDAALGVQSGLKAFEIIWHLWHTLGDDSQVAMSSACLE